MIIYNKIAYATDDSELVDSLFNDGEGTLHPLEKIQKRKNDVKYFIDCDHGFGFNKYGVPFKFRKFPNNKTLYFHTLDEDKETFSKEYNKYFN